MENIFETRKQRLEEFNQLRKKSSNVQKVDIPDDIYIKCDNCQEMISKDMFVSNHKVCPNCNTHYRIGAYERISLTIDEGTFTEFDKDLKTTDPLDFPEYEEKLTILENKLNQNEAVVTGKGIINGIQTVICVLDSNFLMGSMGTVVGEKITRAFEYAIAKKLPVIVFSASGGARMQEGIMSLMQMAKTSAVIAKHNNEGLLYISVLTHPTTGGVTASFAMLGDINIAEPKALIGFAGPRVIKQTIKQDLPEGFQTAEFQKDKGFVDLICEREKMKSKLSKILTIHNY